jgi:L-ribulose-5-phosphate 3-epimerase UlaE
MTTQTEKTSFKESLDAFEEKVQGRLHVYVKETHQGLPTISCLWNETPTKTFKDVVYTGTDESFDALTAVRAVNKSMKASQHVVTMLIEMYTSQNNSPVAEGIDF